MFPAKSINQHLSRDTRNNRSPENGCSKVGYQNIDFDKSGWMMNVGVQFSNIGKDASFTLDDNMFSSGAVEGDQLIMLDADAWNLNQYDKLGSGEGWMLTPADGGDYEFLSAVKANKGDMLYYIPAEASVLTVAGEVAALGEQTIVFDLDNEDGQWMFPLVNPFPIDTKWGDFDTFMTEGDQIISLDGDAWNLNQYDKLAEGEGWMLTPADGGDYEFINNPEQVVIPAGGAVYYIPVETTAWTVTL